MVAGNLITNQVGAFCGRILLIHEKYLKKKKNEKAQSIRKMKKLDWKLGQWQHRKLCP